MGRADERGQRYRTALFNEANDGIHQQMLSGYVIGGDDSRVERCNVAE